MGDAELLKQLCAGQTDALAALYDRYAPLMLALARRMLGDEREAHDLLHDVFLEAWEHARDYQPERGSVRTWLLVRTRSRALDRKLRIDRAKAADLPSETPSQDAHHALAPERIAVRAALERLPTEVRHTLELSYFAGLTGPEIAEQLAVPEGTVRSRLARGLALLEELLEPEADDHD